MNSKFASISLKLDANNYEQWFKTEVEESADLPSMPPLEGDEEKVKELK